jgi:hypothetical protein
MEDLSYLTTEYARNKMIEQYNDEAKKRELEEGNLSPDAVLKNINQVNERYVKINKVEVE